MSELKNQLAVLPIEERAEVARYLLDTLNDAANSDAEAAWDEVLSRREGQIRSGETRGLPAASVFARLRERVA